jgi:hypothetical protein
MRAIYAPLTVVNNADFPLHYDLYIPKGLFNVFDDVRDDNTGASLFLRTSVLINDILPHFVKMSVAVKEQIKSIINHNQPIDRYKEFYELLTRKYNAWQPELKEQTRAVSIKRKFQKG